MGIVGVMSAASSVAYFTTSATASDNEITTGTLTLAVYSTALDTFSGAPGDGYIVAEDVDGVSMDWTTDPGTYTALEAWTNAEPGAYATYGSYAGTDNNNGADTFNAGNRSVWFGVVNTGSLPLDYRFNIDGDWTAGDRFGTLSCPATPVDGDEALVSVERIRRYENGGATPGCQSHEECQNIRERLEFLSYVNTTSAAANLPAVALGVDVDEATPVTLEANQFQIYRVDFNLDTSTDNCYQGATYLYDLNVDGKQLTGAYL